MNKNFLEWILRFRKSYQSFLPNVNPFEHLEYMEQATQGLKSILKRGESKKDSPNFFEGYQESFYWWGKFCHDSPNSLNVKK